MGRKCKNSKGYVFWLAVVVLLSCHFAKAADECLPDAGSSGNLGSVTLNIQSWETRSSNYHTSSPVMLSSHTYTVSKSSKVSTLEAAHIRFYGNQLCIAVTKMIERDPGDGSPSKITSVCLKECISVGGTTNLEIYDGSGGRMQSTSPVCCFWGRRKKLRFFIPPPPTTPPAQYQCVDCAGCDAKDSSRLVTCNAGEKCYTLKLQRQQDAEVTVVKGCSHMLRNWGNKLYCDYKCQTNVKISSEEYSRRYYKVCASCCEGNKCNGAGSAKGGLRGASGILGGYNATVVALLAAQAVFQWLM